VKPEEPEKKVVELTEENSRLKTFIKKRTEEANATILKLANQNKDL